MLKWLLLVFSLERDTVGGQELSIMVGQLFHIIVVKSAKLIKRI